LALLLKDRERIYLKLKFDSAAWLKLITKGEEWVEKLKNRNLAQIGKILTVSTILFFVADVTALVVEKTFPAATPPQPRLNGPLSGSMRPGMSPSDYEIIIGRNLFDSSGSEEEDNQPAAPVNLNPVRTQLPLNLVGTAILTDSKRSIGTIEDKPAQMIYPLRVDDELPGKLRVTKVEPRRVLFVNLVSNRLEYIDLPEEQNMSPIITTSTIKKSFTPSSGEGIKKVSETQYNISRAEVDKSLSNLGQVLTQALARPNFDANGVQNGYKITQIVPGSIYDKIGLKDEEVILGINNESVNDPAKAFQLLNELKTSNHLEIKVKTKDGRDQMRVYDIN